MEEKTSETDNEDLVLECRILASREDYQKVFETFQQHPEVLNYLTIGELGRYARGYRKITEEKRIIEGVRHNIENIIFGTNNKMETQPEKQKCM